MTLTAFTGAAAQELIPTATPTPTPDESATETVVVQRRIARARSLAAVGRLAAAASELESLRASNTDESVRDVARVLLMWIFVEMPDYMRAHALLEETFKERAASQNGEAATHAYYALAGQTINGVRAHLERYRTFGLNVADAELPTEALKDIDQLRGLLERLVEQARALRVEEDAKSTAGVKGLDATALLEDAASVRLRLSRNEQERARWQGEVSEARQRLVASETRIASIGTVSLTRPNPPAAGQPAPAGTTQAPGENKGGGPVAVGSLHSIAKQKSSPSYPSIARTARVTGVVTVHVVVNEKGEVESILRTDGPTQLQGAASDAARRWKFHPTVINAQAVRVTGYISFNFAL